MPAQLGTFKQAQRVQYWPDVEQHELGLHLEQAFFQMVMK
jgi:hypothetical protein